MYGEMDIRDYVFWWYVTFKILCIDRLPVRFPYQEVSAAGGVQAALLICLVLKVKLKLKRWVMYPLQPTPCFQWYQLVMTNRGRRNGFTELQRRSQTRNKDHLCTPLTPDKYLSLTPFTLTFDARQRCYLISLCALIKGVIKYVGDSSQRFDKGAVK